MARFSVSGRTTTVGTSALPNVSLYATAAVRPKVVEIGLFNTSSTACVVALVRLTTAGTPGTGLTEVPEDDASRAAVATAFAGHPSSGPTIGGEIRRASLGAAIGSGVIWTFSGLEIPNTTADGVGIIVPTGTGQTLDYSIAWEE
jgi:hypothetical protein